MYSNFFAKKYLVESYQVRFVNEFGVWTIERGTRTDLRIKTMNHDTTTYQCFSIPGLSTSYHDFTYWASHAHLNEQQDLLPDSQLAQVHRPETTDGHSADRVVQRINVRDRIPSVGGIQDDRANQGGKRTGRK